MDTKMKRILTAVIVAVVAAASMANSVSAEAQPRAIGARMGSGLELSYQHSLIWNSFVEADLGLDYIGQPGMRASASWDFILAEPMWTRGDWAFYLGPSLTMGYLNDVVDYSKDIPGSGLKAQEMGFVFGGGFQFGLEYTFWFPLQLSFDIKPVAGFHVGHGTTTTYEVNGEVIESKTEPKLNFYDYGMFGFIPTLSVRYRF